jgi:hypothetical protein
VTYVDVRESLAAGEFGAALDVFAVEFALPVLGLGE